VNKMDNIKNMKILFFCFLFSITGIFILYIPSYFTPKKEIKSYYVKINESLKQSLAVGILIKINEKNQTNI